MPWWIPVPVDTPFAVYAKMGYGEVSEHTLPDAAAVALGQQAMPERPMEDRFYEQSERLRRCWHHGTQVVGPSGTWTQGQILTPPDTWLTDCT